jgi:hypothetical protein
MEDQRLGPAFTDPFPQAGSADEISGDLSVFPLGDIPRHDLAAPDASPRHPTRGTLDLPAVAAGAPPT